MDDDPGHREMLIEPTTQHSCLGFDHILSVTTPVDERWGLSVWEGCEWGELYDVQRDPGELRNLWDSPDHASDRVDLMLRLVHVMQAHQDTSPFPLDKG